MNLLEGIQTRLRSLLHKPKLDADMDEEMRSHVEMRTRENIKSGISPEEARFAALRQFGWTESIKEDCREQRGIRWLEDLVRDVRFGARQLRKSPIFTLIALLSLALGTGACTSVFSLFNAVLLRSLPVPNPQDLRLLRWSGIDDKIPSFNGVATQTGNRRTGDSVFHPVFLSLREQAAPLADVFGFFPVQEVVVRAQGDPFVADGMMVSDNFFPALGIRPFLGRLFREGDDNPAAGPNIVITHRWWESRFASDPGTPGKTIALNGRTFTVIGVLPPKFPGVTPGDPPDFYVAMQADSPFLFTDITATRHWFVRLMARLKPGADDAQLRSVLCVVFGREAGGFMKEPVMLVEPGRSGPAFDRNRYRNPIRLLAGVVALIMLIACANLAGLSLARSAARQHERAVRVALGSGPWRLVRQSLTESLMLAVLGGGFGCLLALWGRSILSRFLAGSADGLRYDFSLDVTVLGFSAAAALVTALLSGVLPALSASRVNPLDGLKSRGALTAPRLRICKILVVTQISLSLLLLSGAGLYLRSLANLRKLDAGFSTERLLVFEINPSALGYKDADLDSFCARAQDALATIPGVLSATLMEYPLLDHRAWTHGFGLPGLLSGADGGIQAHRLVVGETFFATMGIPLLYGRGFSVRDGGGAPKVLVVNRAFARKFFSSEDPLGRLVKIFGVDWRIVGVCGDAKYEDIKQEVPPTIYTSFRQQRIDDSTCFAVRTALPPLALAKAVRNAVAAIDPRLPVAHLTTEDDLRAANFSQERLLAALCGTLAAIALLLSCIGLHGLMTYHVERRTSEIAIRMAVGAQAGEVTKSILGEAFVLAFTGVGLGLPAVFVLTQFLKSQFYGVQPHDPVTLASVVVTLVIVSLFSAWWPARRAAKVNPMEALRSQ